MNTVKRKSALISTRALSRINSHITTSPHTAVLTPKSPKRRKSQYPSPNKITLSPPGPMAISKSEPLKRNSCFW